MKVTDCTNMVYWHITRSTQCENYLVTSTRNKQLKQPQGSSCIYLLLNVFWQEAKSSFLKRLHFPAGRPLTELWLHLLKEKAPAVGGLSTRVQAPGTPRGKLKSENVRNTTVSLDAFCLLPPPNVNLTFKLCLKLKPFLYRLHLSG